MSTLQNMIDSVMNLPFLLNGFVSRYVTTRLGKAHYLEARVPNSKGTIVFVHGIGAAGGHFGRVLVLLKKAGYSILAPDLPSHGLSSDLTKSLTADLLLGALEAWVDVAIPHEKFFLVGNSMGGGLCLLFSFAHPEKVRRLIVASPVGGFEKEADWNEFQKDFHFDSWLDSKRYLEKVFHTKPLYLPLFYLPFLKAMNRKGVKQLMASAQFEDFLLTDTARKELPPTLFIWGQEEALFTSRNLAQFKKTLPAHVIYEEPADIGHCPQLNDPEWFKSRILDFIRL